MPPVEKKAPRGRPQKAYSPKEAGVVQSMSQYGVPHEDIAATIGMCVETMQRLYSHELAQGRAVANAKIGKRLFDKAISGDTTALIFWAKGRMGWKETQKVEPSLGESGPDAQRDFEAVMAVYRGEK